MPDNISVVPVNATSCNPFLLEVMVFDPGDGFKFEVSVEKSCIKATPGDPAKVKWKLVFDLYKKKATGADFDKIVHVSYTAENAVQEKKIAATTAKGVNQAQSKQLITKVHPAVRDAENLSALPPAEQEKRKQKVKAGMSKTVDLAF
ncbi:MAG: hypothetical protein ABI967_05715 [bacterium]